MTLNMSTLPNTLSDEAVRHLQALLQCNTINPPGNEILAVQYMQEQLATEGIENQIQEAAPGRANLWARLPSNGTKRPLLLVSHTDVVPVERERWTVDPFGGEIREGYIYGRGAVDMKGMTAKQLTLLLHFAREAKKTGRQLSRDIILLSVADEERHGTYGMAWLVQHRPELLEAEYAINEGGGIGLDLGGQRLYLCATGEKGSIHITLRAQGQSGHGSVPHQENSIVRLARAIDKIASFPLPLHTTPTTRQLIAIMTKIQRQPARSLMPQLLNPIFSERMLTLLPNSSTANALRAMLHNTASPTILQAGKAINVIPGEATAQLDGRILPGQTVETFRAELQRRIGDSKVEIQLEYGSGGHECSAKTELFQAIKKSIASHDPGAIAVPYLLPAVTDSRFLVSKGIIAYGFDPMQPEAGWPSPQEMAHGHDERISVANIGFGLRVLHDALLEISQ